MKLFHVLTTVSVMSVAVVRGSKALEEDEDIAPDATGISDEMEKMIKCLGAKKFALPEYPTPSALISHTTKLPDALDSSKQASPMPRYLRLYREHLKDLKRIKWQALINALHHSLTSEHKRVILREFHRGWAPVMTKSIEAEVKALQAEKKDVPDHVANRSAINLAREKFQELLSDVPGLVKYLMMVPLKYSEDIVYEVMCALKSVLEVVISKAPEMKLDDGSNALTGNQVKELKMCLKMVEAMRKKTGPITNQLWFWLLVAVSIVSLIMLAIFTFYYFRR